MTHKDFMSVARYMGADIVFHTAPCAVFTKGPVTISVDITPDDLHKLPDLEVADILATASMMTDKVLGGSGGEGGSGGLGER